MTNNLIYELIFGSHLYGTSDEQSDLDIRGVYLPPFREHLSFKEHKDIRYEDDNHVEYVYHPFQKFVRLAMNNNPSILEWLFVPEEYIKIKTEAINELLKHRILFLSKEIFFRFRGYAESEFNKITKLTGAVGEKRKRQILEHGYCPKNAMNCIRLLYEGIEYLTTYNLILPLEKAPELLDIKHAKWGYQRIANKFQELYDEIEIAYTKSRLPKKVSQKVIDALQIDIILTYASRQSNN